MFTDIIRKLNDSRDLDAAGLVGVGGGLLLDLRQRPAEQQEIRNDVSRNHVAVHKLLVQGLEK